VLTPLAFEGSSHRTCIHQTRIAQLQTVPLTQLTLLPIMERMIQPDSIVYTASFSSYDALDVSSLHHIGINHSERFADKQNHINGIENLWN
jgi:transposase-like protein